jgi:hypothetical protein
MEKAFLTVALVSLILLIAGLWFFVYHVLKQQGRLLLSLDALEHRLGHAGNHAPGAAARPQIPQGLRAARSWPASSFRTWMAGRFRSRISAAAAFCSCSGIRRAASAT